MGFLSYNLNYYKSEIERMESVKPDSQTIYRAKQLLKIIDDLIDENYTQLFDEIETSYQGISRLKAYLHANKAQPFAEPMATNFYESVKYSPKSIELTSAIQNLVSYANGSQVCASTDKFLVELVNFCEWIGYNEDTAYIFLLRDTLLPFIYYQNKGLKNIHPWLIGRKTFEYLTGKPNIDDKLRASIYNALESGNGGNFSDFCKAVLPDMRAVINDYPTAKNALVRLISSINAKRIIVVESGCAGTFPMLIKCLDERVDMRMYTTYPYLLNAYGERIYTAKYEENRLFERLFSQDVYLRFAELKDNRFYVQTCLDNKAQARAAAEVKAILVRS